MVKFNYLGLAWLEKSSALWSLLNAIVGSKAKGSIRLMRQLRSSLSPERFSMVLKKATRNVGTMGDNFRDKIHGYRYTG